MAMKTREDALFNAYLNNYKAAQAQAVNSGVQATQAARQRGAALLNATDKTLPVLKNQLADAYTKADADGNGKVSDTEFKNALLQSPGLSDDDIGKIYLSSKTTDDSTDEKAQTFSATYGPAGVTNYLYLQYLERAYHTAEANRKIAAGEGGNPDGSFNKSDLVNALNYMNLTNEERRAYFSIVAPTWKNPY